MIQALMLAIFFAIVISLHLYAMIEVIRRIVPLLLKVIYILKASYIF